MLLEHSSGEYVRLADVEAYTQATIAALERENYKLREAVTDLQDQLEIQRHNNSALRAGNLQLQRDLRNATDPYGQD